MLCMGVYKMKVSMLQVLKQNLSLCRELRCGTVLVASSGCLQALCVEEMHSQHANVQ
jgi:hypothetical protein